jgi:DNA polymerase-3 subunit epsilon
MVTVQWPSDVAIRERILALLEAQQDQAVPLVTLGREVFRFQNPPLPLLRQIMHRLFHDDPRLILRDDDVVELRPDESVLRPLEESEYVVVDVETTGMRPLSDRVIEVAAIRLTNSGGRVHPVAEFATLVNPEQGLPPTITRLTGITEEMVARAPRFADIADELAAFLGPRVLVAHNARFDLAFLNAEFGRVYERHVGNPQLCTLALSRRLFPELPNHRLPTLARYMGVDLDRWHRASSDAWATARIFLRLLEQLDARGLRTLSEALRFQRARLRTARARHRT